MAGPNDIPRWADDADPAPTGPSSRTPADPNATQAIPQQELLDATTAGGQEPPPAEPPILPPPFQAAPPAWPTDPADDAPTTFQPPVQVAPSGPPSSPPGPPGPIPLDGYDDGDGGNRTPMIIGIAVAVVVILLAATVGVFILTDDDDDTAVSTGGEVVLEAAASNGTDPFTANVATLFDVDKIGGLSPSGNPVDTKATDDDTTKIQARKGTQPGLYGGTLDESSCDVAQLIEFLEANDAKGSAWASVQGIPPDEIADFVKDLTPAVLLEDTRVTNHGYTDGKATSLQSVLQAGTAVMIDDRGMPRVRCACGNPLLPPVPQTGTTNYTGDPWAGFNPGALGAVEPGEPTDVFVMTDIDTGKPFSRPAGSTGSDDALISGTTTTTAPASTTTTSTTSTPTTTSTSTTTTTSTTTPTTAPPTTAPTPTDVTSVGVVSASSEYSADFPASLGVDGDPTTSWFSAGPAVDGDSSVYSWTTLDPGDQFVITDITLVGNGSNADPANRTGYGFESVTIEVLSGGTTTYSETFGLPGTPDPTITARPDALGDTVLLTFTGHEAQDCGGFGELTITGIG